MTRMKGEDLRMLLAEADTYYRDCAKELGINERTVRKHISGESEIRRQAEYAYRWFHYKHTKDKRK